MAIDGSSIYLADWGNHGNGGLTVVPFRRRFDTGSTDAHGWWVVKE